MIPIELTSVDRLIDIEIEVGFRLDGWTTELVVKQPSGVSLIIPGDVVETSQSRSLLRFGGWPDGAFETGTGEATVINRGPSGQVDAIPKGADKLFVSVRGV